MDPNTPDFSLGNTTYNPKQGSFEFFWPLTEQIPLDLDYSQCPPHQYYIRTEGIAGVHGPYPTGMVFVADGNPITSKTSISATNLSFTDLPMPWYRKILFKLIGFKWD